MGAVRLMAIKEKWKQVAWHGALLSLRWLFVPLGWLLVVVALFGPVTQIAKTAQLLVGLLIGIVFGAWPANSAHSFGELTGTLGSPFLYGISGSALIVLGRRAALRASEHVTAADSRRPVVYLRPFTGDRDMARRPLSLGRLFAIRTEEEQLVEVLRGVGPVFAIGKPGERLPLLGASRLYFEGDAWRRQVMDWFSRAALVVIRLPLRQTSGILWEISLSLSQVDHERLVFLVPRCEPDDLAWLNTILQEQHIRPLRLLPPRRRVYGSRISGIIHFSNGAEPQFVPLVRPPLLYRRYSSPLISVYRLSLGPVIERLTGESEAPRKHFGELIAKTCWSIFLIGAVLFLVAAFPKRNSYEWKSMEYQVRLNKIPGLSEAIKREHGHTLQSAGLLRLPDTDLYSIITITDRILQAAPVEACAGMAKGQALDGVWLAEVLNKIAESDSDFLSRWFDLQEKVLIEAMKAPGPPAQLAIGVAAKDLALLTDGMAPANRARYLDIDRSAADAPSSVSAEDLCWAERELFTRLRQLGETAGSRVERTLLLVMFANPSGATHGP